MYLNYNNENLTTTRGDSIHFAVEIIGLNEDLQGASFSCKKNINDETSVFKVTLGNGIDKIDDTHYEVRVPPEVTKQLDIDDYYYDFEITARDDVYTILKGRLKVEFDIS